MSGGLDDVLESLGGFKMPPSGAPVPDMAARADEDYLARREAATAGAERAIEGAGAKRDAIMSKGIGAPKQPTLQNVPKPPDSQFQDPMQAFQNPAVVLAGLASLFTRAPLTAAMNAAGAAMEGFHAGDVERVKLEREKWKDNLDAALKQNGIELEKYRAAMEGARLSQTERMAQMQSVAAGVNDQQMLAALRAGNLDAAYKIRDGREKTQTELMKWSTQEKDRQERETALRAQHTREQDERERHNREVETIARQKTEGASLSDEAIDLAAHRVIAGDPKALTNLGRGAQTGANLSKIHNRVAELGGDPTVAAEAIKRAQTTFAGEMAGERTLGVRAKQLELAKNEAQTLIPRVLERSEKVNRTEYPTLNKIIEAAQTGTGDENVIRLGIAAASLITVYARVLKPTGQITEGDTKRASDILNIAWSKGQIRGALDQMQQEIEAAEKGLEKTKNPGAKTAEPTAAPPAAGGGWTDLGGGVEIREKP